MKGCNKSRTRVKVVNPFGFVRVRYHRPEKSIHRLRLFVACVPPYETTWPHPQGKRHLDVGGRTGRQS